MANNITLAKKYIPMLQEVFMTSSKTAVLDGNGVKVKESPVPGEILIPKRDLEGLGAFSRTKSEAYWQNPYAVNDVKLTYQSIKYDYARSFTAAIDRLNIENSSVGGVNVAGADILGQVVREFLVPEVDAANIAALTGASMTAGNYKTARIADGNAAVAAIRAGLNSMANKSVPMGNLVLFITPTLKGMIEDLDSYKSKAILDNFGLVQELPEDRMYSKIILNDGETNFGYEKAEDALNVGFVIVEKSSVITALNTYLKHFSPDEDMHGDAERWFARFWGLTATILDKKINGVYSHTFPAVNS